MPKDFLTCIKKGGRVRTKRLNGRYIKFCFLNNKSYPSEVKKRKGVKFQKCMGEGLRGKKFRGRAEAQKAFKKLVKICKVK